MRLRHFRQRADSAVGKLTPSQIIVLGYLIVLFIGACLLNLPIASVDGNSIGFIDALFTATSCLCVTGLVVVTTVSYWTLFGKIVIIMLIQIGGIGFMTLLSNFLVLFGKKITLRERLIIRDSFNQSSLEGMVRLVKDVAVGTLIVEGVAAIILCFVFVPDFGWAKGIWFGVFHAISGFCNAGFDIIGNDSLKPYVSNVSVNVVIMLLITLGGLGFAVWLDILKTFKLVKEKNFSWNNSSHRLSLHSKIVLSLSGMLILIGAVFFFCAEYKNPDTLGPLDLGTKILASFFQSVTLRTAGYYSIDQHGMGYASKFMSIILMFIGGSPGGTAGGIKTVTLSVIMIVVYSVITGRNSVQAFKKNIPIEILQKALTVVMINLFVIIVATIILTFTEKNMAFDFEFIDLLFETTSATGTVGLTLGITPYLSPVGKIVICIAMFVGRVGTITFAMALAVRQNAVKSIINYPEEKVIVG